MLWLRSQAVLSGLLLLTAPAVLAQGVEPLARAFAKTPSAKTRAALEQFAARYPTSVDGALASLALGAADATNGDTSAAISRLSSLQRRLPALADYTSFWIASAQMRGGDAAAARAALEPVWATTPVSPVLGRSAATGADALLKLQQPKAALLLLSKYAEHLPQPQGYLLLAQAEEGSGNQPAAVAWYQSVYFGYPLAPEEADAGAALQRLAAALGPRFPPALAATRLERANKLLEGKRYPAARAEFTLLARELSGTERDIARVRIGVVDYQARQTQAAARYLSGLSVSAPEAAAERLYYLASAGRRLKDDAAVQDALAQLAARHKTSPWRLKTLLMAPGLYLVNNEPASYLPVYRAVYENFPEAKEAAGCHWRVVWNAWIERKREARAMLTEHLEKFPASEKANAALYFLGRLSEQEGDLAAARRFYQEVPQRYPNTYYTLQARARLESAAIAKAGLSPATTEFLNRIPAPQRAIAEFEPNAVSAQRTERARLLSRAGLDYWSDNELRFGARRDAQPFVMATELATLATRRGEVPKGLRHLKGTAAGYLSLPYEAAPEKFWKLAFPFPYRASITAQANNNGLDPFLVAGLIRQESEFDPAVVSYASAIGLTQVMPGTGRDLSRKVGVTGYSTAKLKDAETNLRLGTHYLRSILDSFDGRIEPTLASYNAGKSRADRWLTWADYREPAEFIESIPFEQTREYVQILLRNADVYKRLYRNERVIAEDVVPPSPRPATAAPKPTRPPQKAPQAKGKAKAKPRG